MQSGLRREQDHHSGRQQDSTLIRPVRVDVHERRFEASPPPRLGYRRDDLRQCPAVIEVPVRKEDTLDRRQVDAESRGVVLPDRSVRTHVEKQRVLPIAAGGGGEHREPVTGATKTVEHHLARMAFELARGGQTTDEAGHLGRLRDALVNAGQRVRLVVHDDGQPELVELCNIVRAHGQRLITSRRAVRKLDGPSDAVESRTVSQRAQIAAVAAGYGLAIAAGIVAGRIYDARVAALPYDTSGGMYAGGEAMTSLGTFLVVALVPTVLALWFLRRNEKVWNALAVASIAFAVAGLVAVSALPMLRSGGRSAVLALLGLLGVAQLL